MNKFEAAATIEEIQYYVLCPNCNEAIESIDAKLELSPSQTYYFTRQCKRCDRFYDIKVYQDGQTFIKAYAFMP